MSLITSRDNPRVRRWRELARDAGARREQSRALIEGPHLVSACLSAGRGLKSLILSKSGANRAEFADIVRRSGKTPQLLADPVFRSIADTGTPTGIAAEIAVPASAPDLQTSAACVFLEGIQDAGNVGAMLRSAAAFGIEDAVLGPGCADAWSPKVLRAAMGAHFSMKLGDSTDLAAAVRDFGGSVVCTVPRGGVPLAAADLSGRVGWIFGAEGQGVSKALAGQATLKVSIPMAGLTESLNVAAAAAICFYQSSLAGDGA